MIVMIGVFDFVFIKSHSILIVIQRKLVILIDNLIGISGIVRFIVYQFVIHKLYKVKWQKRSIFRVFDFVFIKSHSILIVSHQKN